MDSLWSGRNSNVTKPSERPGRGFIHKTREKLNEKSPDGRGKVFDPDGEPLSMAIWEHPHGWSVSLQEWKDKEPEDTVTDNDHEDVDE